MLEQGFSFEQWVVTPADRVVSGPRGDTKLEPKVMEVFVDLAVHAGEVVSRYELIDRVWRGAIVGDEVLSRCIYQIRRALGESSRHARYLETIPKRGYRLNATVVDLAEETETGPGLWTRGSPFRGLQAFDLEHAPVYFGRARATLEALNALRAQHDTGRDFLLLLGASGVGKSSLARAGVLHHLTRNGVVDEVDRWGHAVLRPSDSGDGPLRSLTDALAAARRRLNAGGSDTSPESITQKPEVTPAEAIVDEMPTGTALAIVVDQLEEVFSAEHTTDEQREAFFAALEDLATSGRCWVIATLRSDFYPQCTAHEALMRLKKGSGQYDVLPMRPAEIGQSIRLPAKATGLRFERDPKTGHSLDEMLHDAAMAAPRLLPLLEFTLQELYEQRTADGTLPLAAYREIGGIEGSLARRADSVFAALPATQREALPELMSCLVRLDGDRVSSARQALSALPSDAARELARSLVDARLLFAELDEAGEPRVGIAHEALLTHWPRVRQWIADNRELIRVRDRVLAARRRWQAEDRREDLLLPRGRSLQEAERLATASGIQLTDADRQYIALSSQRAARRRFWERAAAAALAALSVIAGGAAWLASAQRDEALEQRAVAEREAEAARASADFLIGIFEVADPSEAGGGRLTARDVLDQGLAQLDSGLADQKVLQLRLRVLIARAYAGLGLYGDAEALLRQADLEADSASGLEARERLDVRFQLAQILVSIGELDEAERLHAEVLTARRDLFGEDDLDTADSLAARAHELWRNGDAAAAEPLFERVLALRKEKLGPTHRDVVDMLGTLGTFHYQLGLRDEAAGYFREAAALSREAYGERHVRTAVAISNVAFVEPDPARREALLRESLEIRTEILGDDHPLVARAQANLAGFYGYQGEAEKADTYYRQAIATLSALPDETPEAPNLLNRYGLFLQSQERYADAADVFRQAADGFARQLGESHRHTGILQSNLAYALYLSGDLAGAERLFRELIGRYEGPPDEDVSFRSTLKSNLARVLLAQGQYDQALPLAETAVAAYETDTTRFRVGLAGALATLADARLATGDAAGALDSAERALEIGEGDFIWRLAAYRSLAGAARVRLGDCAGGIGLLEQAYGEMPDTVASARGKREIAARLSDAYRSCDRSEDAAALALPPTPPAAGNAADSPAGTD